MEAILQCCRKIIFAQKVNNMRLTEEQRELRWQMENIAYMGIRVIEYFNGITGNGGEFWMITQNCYGEKACHMWCQLFNSYSDPTHYTKLFGDDRLIELDPLLSFANVRDRLIASTGLSHAEYDVFRGTVIDFRNKYSAHREYDSENVTFPELDLALLMLHEIRDILKLSIEKELINCSDKDISGQRLYYEHNTGIDLQRRCRNDISKIQFFE